MGRTIQPAAKAREKRNGSSPPRIGERIHDLRRSFDLTQEELAHRSNLTKGFISQLERDLTSPSLESLMGILRALDTDIVEFFRGQDEARFIFGAADRTNADTYPEVSGFELLVPGAANCEMEPAIITLAPGEELEEKSHAGEEFGYVLQGQVAVKYGKRQTTARRGECFYYVADRSHGVLNASKKPAKFLWISTPTSF